jgi:hypothetical protein
MMQHYLSLCRELTSALQSATSTPRHTDISPPIGQGKTCFKDMQCGESMITVMKSQSSVVTTHLGTVASHRDLTLTKHDLIREALYCGGTVIAYIDVLPGE